MFSNFRDFEPIHIYIILTIYLTNIYSAGRFEAFMPVCMDFDADADADANADADAPRVSDIRKLHTLERTIVPRMVIFHILSSAFIHWGGSKNVGKKLQRQICATVKS